MVDLNRIATEQRNPDTMDIDRVSTLEMEGCACCGKDPSQDCGSD